MTGAVHFLELLSWPLLLWSGLVAYVASTFVLMLLRRFKATRYLPRAYWSCALLGTAGTAALLVAGFVRFVAYVALFPLLYALIFRRLGSAQTMPGLEIGLVHGLIFAALLPLSARRCPGAYPPGWFGWNLGRTTPLVLLITHAAYGALIGYLYVLPA